MLPTPVARQQHLRECWRSCLTTHSRFLPVCGKNVDDDEESPPPSDEDASRISIVVAGVIVLAGLAVLSAFVMGVIFLFALVL